MSPLHRLELYAHVASWATYLGGLAATAVYVASLYRGMPLY